MHSFVTSKNVKWCHLIWPTLYSALSICHAIKTVLFVWIFIYSTKPAAAAYHVRQSSFWLRHKWRFLAFHFANFRRRLRLVCKSSSSQTVYFSSVELPPVITYRQIAWLTVLGTSQNDVLMQLITHAWRECERPADRVSSFLHNWLVQLRPSFTQVDGQNSRIFQPLLSW